MNENPKYIVGEDVFKSNVDNKSHGAIVIFNRQKKRPVYVSKKLWVVKLLIKILPYFNIQVIQEKNK